MGSRVCPVCGYHLAPSCSSLSAAPAPGALGELEKILEGVGPGQLPVTQMSVRPLVSFVYKPLKDQ